MKSFPEMSLSELVAYFGGTMATPPAGPTVREIWDATPSGEAIRVPAYLDLCQVVSDLADASFPDFAKSMPELWDMTPAKASGAVCEWAKRERKRNPDYLLDLREEHRKNFFA